MKIYTCSVCKKHFQSIYPSKYCKEHEQQNSKEHAVLEKLKREEEELELLKKVEKAREIKETCSYIEEQLEEFFDVPFLSFQIDWHNKIERAIRICVNKYDDSDYKIMVLKAVLQLFKSKTLRRNLHSSNLGLVVISDANIDINRLGNGSIGDGKKYQSRAQDGMSVLFYPQLHISVKPFLETYLQNDNELKELWDFNLLSYKILVPDVQKWPDELKEPYYKAHKYEKWIDIYAPDDVREKHYKSNNQEKWVENYGTEVEKEAYYKEHKYDYWIDKYASKDVKEAYYKKHHYETWIEKYASEDARKAHYKKSDPYMFFQVATEEDKIAYIREKPSDWFFNHASNFDRIKYFGELPKPVRYGFGGIFLCLILFIFFPSSDSDEVKLKVTEVVEETESTSMKAQEEISQPKPVETKSTKDIESKKTEEEKLIDVNELASTNVVYKGKMKTITNLATASEECTVSIKEVVRNNRKQVTFCYDNELKSNPSLQGKLVLEFAIKGGTVKNFTITRNQTGSKTLTMCVEEEVTKWKFPKNCLEDLARVTFTLFPEKVPTNVVAEVESKKIEEEKLIDTSDLVPTHVVYNTHTDQDEPWLNVRSSANSDANILGVLADGSEVFVHKKSGKWYEISAITIEAPKKSNAPESFEIGKKGWVSSSYLQSVEDKKMSEVEVQTLSVEVKNISEEPRNTFNKRMKKAAEFQLSIKAKTEKIDEKKLDMSSLKITEKTCSKGTKSKCKAVATVELK